MTHAYVEKQLLYAKEQYKLENYGRAEKAINQVLNSKLSEYREEAFFLKGSILFWNNQFEESINSLTACLEVNPLFTEALSFRVQSYIQSGKFYEARLDAEKLLNINPDEVNSIESLLSIARITKDYDLIIECCTKIISIDPDSYGHIIERADNYFFSKEYQKAIFDFKRGLVLLKKEEKSDPDSEYSDYFFFEAGLLNEIAECYIKLEDYNRAEDYLKKAMGLSEDDEATICLMGYLLHKKGNSEKGMYFLLKAKSISPYNCDILLYLARTYIDLDDGYRAYECITKVNELDEAEDYKESVEELMSFLEFE